MIGCLVAPCVADYGCLRAVSRGRWARRAHAAKVGGRQHVAGFGVVHNKGVQAQAARIGALLQSGRRPLRRQRRRRRRRRILAARLRLAKDGSAGHDTCSVSIAWLFAMCCRSSAQQAGRSMSYATECAT